MVRQSESIASLAAALSAAQGEIENASKNAKNPHFKSNYADLAEIINTVRPVLSKHGLAVAQFPGFENGIATVDTVLTHKSGEWMAGMAGSPIPKQDPQGIGSATTYLRRYSLAAVCGIAQEDDDGNTASKATPKAKGPDPLPGLLKTVTDTLEANRANLPASGVTATEGAIKAKDVGRLRKALDWMRDELAKENAA